MIPIMDLESIRSEFSNKVYESSRMIEDLENQGLYEGNGHHARQVLATLAELLVMAGTNQLSEELRTKVFDIRKLINEAHTEARK